MKIKTRLRSTKHPTYKAWTGYYCVGSVRCHREIGPQNEGVYYFLQDRAAHMQAYKYTE